MGGFGPRLSAVLGAPPTQTPSRPTQTAAPRFSPRLASVLGVPPSEEEPGFLDKVKEYATPANALRIGLPIAGGILGSVVPGAGTAAGVAIGGALGGALGGAAGELGAQALEGKEIDPGEIALAGALSAIPAGPAGRLAAKPGLSLLKRAALHGLEGAGQGVLDVGATTAYREGRLPTAEEIASGAVFGAGVGGTLGTGLDSVARTRAALPESTSVRPVQVPETVDARLSAKPQPMVPENLAGRPLDPAALETRPPETWFGEAPQAFEPPTAPPIDPIAERAFLTPDRVAQTDAEQARLAREFVQQRPGAETVSRDQGELGRLGPKIQRLTDSDLQRRLDFYGRENMPESLAAVQAEMSRRAPVPELEAAMIAPEAPGAPLAQVDGERAAEGPETGSQGPSGAIVEQRTDSDLRAATQKFIEDNPEATREQLVEEVRRLRGEAQESGVASVTDTVTGLANKRGWDERLKSVNPDSDHVAIVDIKGFKPINDRIGHSAGDEVLKRIGNVVKKHFGDDAARQGGDEFGGILRGMTPEDAQARVEAFREDLRGLQVTVRNKITGETLDIPGFEAHIGVARDAEAADLAQNLAREQLGSGRDVPTNVQGADAPVAGPVEAAPGPLEPGVGDRPGELAAPAAPKVQLPEPGNVKPATVFSKGRTGPGISPRSASLLEAQIKLAQESGLEDFPLFQKKANKLIFDGEAALKRLQTPKTGTAFELGAAFASGGENVRDVLIYGASLLEKGIRNFPDWARAMREGLGDRFGTLGDQLKELWQQTLRHFEGSKSEFTATEEPFALPAEPAARKPLKPIPPGSEPGQKQTAPPSEPPPARSTPAAPTESKVPGFWGKVLEYRRNALLSGPPTHLVNPASTGGEGLVRSLESAVGGVVDRMMGGQRTRFSGEAREQLKGAVSGMPEALNRLKRGLRSVLDTEGAIGGKTGKAVRVPQQLMSVEDDVVRALNEQAVLQSFAYREAKRTNLGGTKAQIEAAQNRILQNPPAGFMDRVEKEIRSRQFKLDTDPEGWLKKFGEARSKSTFWQVVLPFYETPAAIGKLVAERSPAGFVPAIKAFKAYRNALRKGITGDALAEIKGEAVDKLARPVVGTALLGLFSGIAHSGFMTGGGPTDLKEKRTLLETGWQPYSFKLGDTYVPFNRFEPVSSLLGFAADMAEARNAKDQADLVNKALASVAQNLTSKTYLQGLADAAEFITNPGEAATGYVPGLAASFVPNIVKKAAQATDPTLRDTRPEAKGLLGTPERTAKTVAAGIPGLSRILPERRSGTGEVIQRPGNAVSRFLAPAQITRTKPGTDLEKLLVDIDAVPSAPQRELTIPNSNGRKIRLTDEEYDTLQDSQKKATDRLRGLVRRPDFRRLDAEEQKAIIERFYNQERTRDRKKLWQNRQLRQRASKVLREARA